MRLAKTFWLTALMTLTLALPVGAAELVPCTVTRVVDGDTFHCSSGGEDLTIRLTGVDCAEMPSEAGQEATDFVKNILPRGASVELELDVRELDRYRRTLAYVWLADGRMLNVVLLEEGQANLMTVPPNIKYLEEFKNASSARPGREEVQ